MSDYMMLAKTYKDDAKYPLYPCYVTEKLDGVPGIFNKTSTGIQVLSRQGKPLYNVTHILEQLSWMPVNTTVIGELYLRDKTFKEISGIVRTQHVVDVKLELHIFEFVTTDTLNYNERMSLLDKYLPIENYTKFVKVIPKYYAKNKQDVEDIAKGIYDLIPNAEGVVLRQATGSNSYYDIGYRSPGMIKWKRQETLDLPIISFEEAVDADGNTKGMVGRINVLYKDRVIGIGPGKLTHEHRKHMFETSGYYYGKFVEVMYMPDDSYDALREARVHRLREDKGEIPHETWEKYYTSLYTKSLL